MYHVELMLLVISLLFFASIFTDKLSSKFGIPALLLFLAVQLKFVFSNDECASKKVKGFKQKLESLSFLKELAEKLERDAKKGE